MTLETTQGISDEQLETLEIPTIYSKTDPRIKESVQNLSEDQLQHLIRMLTPRVCDEYMVHNPHPVQQFALTLNDEEVLFGGAAGGGKSDYLLMAALQYVDVPGYSALILRRTWPDLIAPGAILDRAKTWFEGKRVRMRDEGRMWQFPSGATMQFGTLQYHKDTAKYMSAEYQFIGFDELTHWREQTYKFMFSRVRRPVINCLTCNTPLRMTRHTNQGTPTYKHVNKGYDRLCDMLFPDPRILQQYPPAKDGVTLFDVPLRVRSATNPGNIGHQWVKNHFIDPKTRNKKSIFIPSLISDNPALDQESYRSNLMHLTPVDRERMMNGDWDVSEEGALFQRHKFNFTETMPMEHQISERVRFWDLAASVTDTSDWTVGAKVLITKNGYWFIEDIVRLRGRPAEVERTIQNTAALDGRFIKIRMEQEPGSAGVNNIANYRRILSGYNFDGWRATGDKEQRAGSLSTQVDAGNVYCKIASWNVLFLDEITLFPTGEHDDQVDAVVHGFDTINFGRKTRLLA